MTITLVVTENFWQNDTTFFFSTEKILFSNYMMNYLRRTLLMSNIFQMTVLLAPCVKQMVQRVIILQLTTPLPFKIYSTCNGELVVVGYLLALLTLVLLLTLVHRYNIVGRCAAAARTRC